GVFQRLGMSADGALIVFEMTDDFSILSRSILPPEQEGIYSVRGDGTGLHRLGPQSRDSSFRFVSVAPASILSYFPVAPNAELATFTDLGPGPTGEEVVQVFTIDLASGERTQVTHLPFASSPDPVQPVTFSGYFVDDDNILFVSVANPDGLNPDGVRRTF